MAEHDPMSDHDATREILAAADDYASTWGAFNFCDAAMRQMDSAMRQMDSARAHLETTIRRALARGAAIEAAAGAVVDDAGDSIDCFGMRYVTGSVVDRLRAALAAGAGVTTEGEDG